MLHPAAMLRTDTERPIGIASVLECAPEPLVEIAVLATGWWSHIAPGPWCLLRNGRCPRAVAFVQSCPALKSETRGDFSNSFLTPEFRRATAEASRICKEWLKITGQLLEIGISRHGLLVPQLFEMALRRFQPQKRSRAAQSTLPPIGDSQNCRYMIPNRDPI